MILVTGGTGTVGSEVVKLLSQGQKLRVLARSPSKVLQHANVEVTKGDLADRAAITAALKGVTKVFLLSNSVPESIGWQFNVIEEAKKANVAHLVRLSVISADLASPVRLSRWHADSDAYARSIGLNTTTLHPAFFMSNFLGSAASVKKDGAFYGCAGEGKAPFIDPRDIAQAAVLCLTTPGHDGKAYTLTGPEAFSQAEVAQKLSTVTGKTVRYVNLPPAQFKAGLTSAGLADWYASDFCTMHAFFASGGAAGIDPTLSKLIGKARSFDAWLTDFGAAFK